MRTLKTSRKKPLRNTVMLIVQTQHSVISQIKLLHFQKEAKREKTLGIYFMLKSAG